jgi:hypothetical protein
MLDFAMCSFNVMYRRWLRFVVLHAAKLLANPPILQ